MVVTKKVFYSLLLTIGLCSEQLMAMTKTKIKTLLNIYDQNGGQGEQIYGVDQRESATVIEPMLFIDHIIDENTTINGHFVLDGWTAASDTQLDGNTGASGGGVEKAIEHQSRGSAQIGITKDYKSWLWSSRIGISSEYDYKSLNFGGTVQQNFAQDNFVLAISPQVFLDRAKKYDLIAQDVTEFSGRTIYSLDISASQILTASNIVQAGATYIHMHGMMDNISNTVKVLSNPYSNALSRVEERLPDSRERYALSIKDIQAFSDETSLHAGYRYYDDTWGITAHTAELSLVQSYFEDDGLLKLSYRHYSQGANKYYAHEFATSETFMTSDSDMESFSGNRYGIHYGHNFGDYTIWGVQFVDFQFDNAIYYYKRSNDLTYSIAQMAFNVQF